MTQPIINGRLLKSRHVNGGAAVLSLPFTCISLHAYFNFDNSCSKDLFSEAAAAVGEMFR